MSASDCFELDLELCIPDCSETPPTLEEILQKENDFNIDDDLVVEQQKHLIISNEDDYINSNFDGHNSQKVTSFCIKELSNIKTQLSLSKSENVNSGNPTCLVASENFLAIGTFYGHILIFDCDEKLKWFLKHQTDFGSITSCTIHRDESKLLCGGSKGAIALWNLHNGELFRVMEDLHSPFSSVLNLKYLSNSNFAILGDSSGSVFVLDCRKKDLDSQCVFSGSRGEVLALQPLMADDIPNSPNYAGLDTLCLVAMATVSKLIIISIRPVLLVHFTFPLRGHVDFLPLLCWNLSFRSADQLIPLLCFGREDKIYIHKLVVNRADKIDFVAMYEFTTSNYNLQHISWIDCEFLLIMDTNESLHLVDVEEQEEVEKTDFWSAELVYESAHYKSLVNGGYVSKAMARAGEHACGNSVALRRAHRTQYQLFVLGLHSVHQITLRTWSEKVDYLIDKGYFLNALQLLFENCLIIKDRMNNLVEGNQELIAIQDKMELAFQHFRDSIAIKPSLNVDRNAYRSMIAIALQYCLCLKFPNEKLYELYEIFSANSTSKEVFIECLEPYIFGNQLTDLNPLIVKEVLDYYIDKQWFHLLDSLLVHIDITSLDIDFIIKFFHENSLYDTYIYIHNCAFEDFITPLNQLLKMLEESTKSEAKLTEKDILIGNKLLVYLNCALTCIYYPNKGRVALDREETHLEQMYARLLARDSTGKQDALLTLLIYDCTEFMNVILIAFEFLNKNNLSFEWQQKLTDSIISTILKDNLNLFDMNHQNALYIFLARCLVINTSLQLSNQYFDMMIESLFDNQNKRFEERQQNLINLFQSGLIATRFDLETFRINAEASKMFKILELIYRNEQNWIQLFLVYVQDVSKKSEIFEYIHFILSQDKSYFQGSISKEDFLLVVFEHFLVLVKLDCQQAVDLFFSYMHQCDNLFELVTQRLDVEPLVLYDFLRVTILENRINYAKLASTGTGTVPNVYRISLNRDNQERLIELACKFKPNKVTTMLDSLQEYDDDSVLAICHKYEIRDAEAFLCEKLKRFSEAHDILYQEFVQHVTRLIDVSLANLAKGEVKFDTSSVTTWFDKLLSFCDRVSKHAVDEQLKEQFFLKMLQYLIDTKLTLNNIRKLNDDKYLPQYLNLFEDKVMRQKLNCLVFDMNSSFKLLFEKWVNCMLTHLSLVKFLEVIINKLLQANDDIYDIREMLMCILDNYNYEKTLLELTTNILAVERHQLLNEFKTSNTKSKHVNRFKCLLCMRFVRKQETLQLYECRHLFHIECIEVLRKMKNVDATQCCPLCSGMIDDQFLTLYTEARELNEQFSLFQEDSNETNNTDRSQLVHLNDTQIRALNHLHNGRLKRNKRIF